MAQFTVIQSHRVMRVSASSIQALTASMRKAGQHWLAIHQDKEES